MNNMNEVEAVEYCLMNCSPNGVAPLNERLKLGWKLYGSPIIAPEGIYQAMVRSPEPKHDASQDKLPLGIEAILEEYEHARSRYSPEHDARHTTGMLATQAAELLVEGTGAWVDPSDPRDRDAWGLIAKTQFDRLRQLRIAGALVAAEIERVQQVLA